MLCVMALVLLSTQEVSSRLRKPLDPWEPDSLIYSTRLD
jgi:hypothetical protein